MADSPSEFRRKTEAMMAQAEHNLDKLGRLYIHFAAKTFLDETPGFGNQYDPPDGSARYVPTGRLRGGLNWTRAPILQSGKGYNARRHEDGPFSPYGVETRSRIDEQLAGVPVGGMSYLENDVAYGWDIVNAKGNHAHIGIRDFPGITAAPTNQTLWLRQALQEF